MVDGDRTSTKVILRGFKNRNQERCLVLTISRSLLID